MEKMRKPRGRPRAQHPVAGSLGARLVELRGGRLIMEIAKLARVSKSSLSRWERGVYLPDLTSVRRLEEVYGVALAGLVPDRRPRE